MKSHIKIIITAVITAAVTFSVTTVYHTANRFGAFTPYSSTQELQNKLDTVNTYLENNYLYDDVDYDKANDAAVKAYVESLEEPYTHYYTKDEYKSYMSNVEESYVGIGVIISPDAETDKIVVISPLKDSPAYESGLKSGDYIVAVDGKEFNAAEMDACVSAIKSDVAGTKVKIMIERDGEQKEFEIERKEIVENSVSYEMLDRNVGYISISSFNTNSEGSENSTYTEFVTAVEALKKDGMEKLIIDVRSNPGGVLGIVCDIADYILPEGTITYTETKMGERQEYKSDEQELDIPMAVLINGSSASASEILAGALKDYDRAVLVGQTSFGKGIVQSVLPFADGSGMSMTVSKYFTPKGISIHEKGIKPDVEVELPEEFKDSYIYDIPKDKDTQLNKAIEILNSK